MFCKRIMGVCLGVICPFYFGCKIIAASIESENEEEEE